MRSPSRDRGRSVARQAQGRTRRQREHGARLRHRNVLLQAVRKIDARRRLERSRETLRGQTDKARAMVRSARRRARRAARHR